MLMMLLSAALAAPPPSHCASQEQVVLSCEVKGGKVLSLCAPAGPLTYKTVVYRFGPPGKPELTLNPTHAGVELHASTDTFPSSIAHTLQYTKGEYSYGVWVRVGGCCEENNNAGVVVETDGKDVVRWLCEGPLTERLDELFPLQ